jgi:hypothetical protein
MQQQENRFIREEERVQQQEVNRFVKEEQVNRFVQQEIVAQ